jgi:hypothetical protein
MVPIDSAWITFSPDGKTWPITIAWRNDLSDSPNNRKFPCGFRARLWTEGHNNKLLEYLSLNASRIEVGMGRQ